VPDLLREVYLGSLGKFKVFLDLISWVLVFEEITHVERLLSLIFRCMILCCQGFQVGPLHADKFVDLSGLIDFPQQPLVNGVIF
jgi:hypothetical protein